MAETENTDSLHREWQLVRLASFMAPTSILLAFVALYGFSRLANLLGFDGFSTRVTPDQYSAAFVKGVAFVLAIVIATAVIFICHEWVHATMFRAFGAKPRYGRKMLAWFFPVIYVTAPGKTLSRLQYLLVLLMPTVVINTLGIGLMAILHTYNWILVFPLAAHAGGCVGDWWVSLILLTMPAGARFEDTADGFRYTACSNGEQETA